MSATVNGESFPRCHWCEQEGEEEDGWVCPECRCCWTHYGETVECLTCAINLRGVKK
jgi:hypothetical protein